MCYLFVRLQGCGTECTDVVSAINVVNRNRKNP